MIANTVYFEGERGILFKKTRGFIRRELRRVAEKSAPDDQSGRIWHVKLESAAISQVIAGADKAAGVFDAAFLLFRFIQDRERMSLDPGRRVVVRSALQCDGQ